MLGEYISDPYGIEGGGETEGVFEGLQGVFAALNGMTYTGYEIHQGVTEGEDGPDTTDGAESGAKDAAAAGAPGVFGTYVHGVFDREGIAETLVNALLERRGLEKRETAGLDYDRFKSEQYDILADALEQSLDLEELKKIMGL